MSRTLDAVVWRSTAVRQAAAAADAAGTPLTQDMVDVLERLRLHGVAPAEAVPLVRSAYQWYGPGAEADAYIADHLELKTP